MSLRTYNHTLKHELLEKTIGIKAKKTLAQTIMNRLDRLASINKYTRQLSGIKGCTEGYNRESTSLIMAFCTSKALLDQGAFDIEYDQWIDHLPGIISDANMGTVLVSADELFNKHVIVEDNRRTPEEETRGLSDKL